MAELWMPGVTRLPPTGPRQGLTMTGTGERYFTWHTFEGSDIQHRMTALQGAAALNRAGSTPHFCGNPITGDLVQMLPADVGAYTLANAPGGPETNRAGSIHMQIEMLAEAREPWTEYATPAGWAMVARLMDFLESWGIPRVWPAGQPAATAAGPHNRIGPGPPGHYGHSQWKDQEPSLHWDPGALDIRRILAATTAADPDPKVLARQRELVAAGLLEASDVDGIDGPQTQAAWRRYMAALDDIASQLARLTDKVDALPRAVWSYRLAGKDGRDASFWLRYGAGGVKTDPSGNEVAVPVTPPALDAPTGGAL